MTPMAEKVLFTHLHSWLLSFVSKVLPSSLQFLPGNAVNVRFLLLITSDVAD